MSDALKNKKIEAFNIGEKLITLYYSKWIYQEAYNGKDFIKITTNPDIFSELCQMKISEEIFIIIIEKMKSIFIQYGFKCNYNFDNYGNLIFLISWS